jgi:hypothetical protein
MKKSLLLSFILIFTLSVQAQKDTADVFSATQKDTRDVSTINVSIYPVPVRENSFTIRTDREVSSVKITNIIGQDIFRAQYNNPQSVTKILLNNPRRGMYLVTIVFSEGTRIVKKIMIEQTE